MSTSNCLGGFRRFLGLAPLHGIGNITKPVRQPCERLALAFHELR